MKQYITIASLCLASGIAAFATPVTPTFSSIGSIPGANYGGNNNPPDVAITTFTDANNNTVTLGLAAQNRYNNTSVTDNGAGTYYALTGSNKGGPGNPSSFTGALWNFDFYFDSTGGNYTYQLLYGTDASSLITINPAAVGDNTHPLAPKVGGENSENLLFGDFGGVANTLAFNPNAVGIYSFELIALLDGRQVGQAVAINVSVGSAPDVSSTAGLLGLGVVGLMLVNFRRTRMARAK